jgi:metal-responsive CopG/Arc/MetJ family transcriptional regulator
MGRTQIYLGAEERAILDRVAEATGASRSELIRRAIRSTFAGGTTKADRIRAVEASAGAWRDRSQSGAEYVDAVRGDLNERLRKLGLA